jgi:hypothetical protein
MQIVPEKKNLPNINRISVLSAAILLAYTVAGFITLPERDLTIQLPRILTGFNLNAEQLIAFLVAGLTATGADWLVREHPSFQERNSIQHWLLPSLTAWAIGSILYQQPFSILWWIIFAVGGTILILVLIAEYIIVDPEDIRRIPAIIGLTALSFALFLTLAITVRAIEFRIFLLAPMITMACGLTSLRTLHLLLGRWAFRHAAVIAIVIGQLSAALNYIRINPITFGLVLLGPAYALTSFFGSSLDKNNRHQITAEPIIVLIIVWGLAILLK